MRARMWHLVAPAAVLAASCVDPNGPDLQDDSTPVSGAITLTPNQQAIDNVLSGSDIVLDANGQPYSTNHTGTDYATNWDGQKYLLCASDRYTANASTNQPTNLDLDPNAPVMFPGSLVHAKDANTGTLSPILLPRSGGTVSLTSTTVVQGPNARTSTTVDEFTVSKVNDAIRGMLLSGTVNNASTSSYSIQEGKSFEEAMLKVGLDAKVAKAKFQGSFSTRSWTEKTNLVMKFSQSYYTVVPEWPYPAVVFAPDVTGTDVANAMWAVDDPILYVGSVTYGRMAYLRVTSEKSSSEIDAALTAAYNSAVVNATLQLTDAQKQLLSSATIEAYQVGGAFEIITGPDALKAYMQRGATWSTDSLGAPISYTLRALKSGKTFSAKYTSDFVIPSCTTATDKEVVGFTLPAIHFSNNGDAAGQGDTQYVLDLGITTANGATSFLYHLNSPGRIKTNDGADLTLNWSPPDLQLTRADRIALHMRVWDQNNNIFSGWKDDDNIDTTVYFRFDAATHTWVPEQSPMRFVDQQLSIVIAPTLTRKSPCSQYESWDTTKDLCVPPNAGPNLRVGLLSPDIAQCTATATSTFSGYSPAKVIDGDTSTALGGAYSWANNSGTAMPQTVEVNFNGVRGVQDVTVYTTASYPISDYDVEVWNGKMWLPFASYRGNTAPSITHHASAALRGTALRLIGRRGPSIQPTYVRVNELVIR